MIRSAWIFLIELFQLKLFLIFYFFFFYSIYDKINRKYILFIKTTNYINSQCNWEYICINFFINFTTFPSLIQTNQDNKSKNISKFSIKADVEREKKGKDNGEWNLFQNDGKL